MTMELVAPDKIAGLAIPFGSPSNRDLQGEYFTKRTDFHWDWFPQDGRPVLYHHGTDGELAGKAIGRQISHEIDDEGVWVEVQLEKRAKYLDQIRRLLDAGALGFSSGALPYLVKTVKSTGEILSWPWVELSTTPTPAALNARIVAVKHFTMGTNLPGSVEAALNREQYERLCRAIDRGKAAEDAYELYRRLERQITRADIEHGRWLARLGR